MSYRRCLRVGCFELIEFHSPKKYCSDSCRQKAYRLRSKPKPKRNETVPVKTCKNCGKKFASLVKLQKFCKVSCRVSFYQQRKRMALKGEII